MNRENHKGITLEKMNAEWDALTPEEQEERLEEQSLSLSKKERKILQTIRQIAIERMNKAEGGEDD